MGSANLIGVGSVLCWVACGIAQASYIHGYTWDYTASFSQTDNPAKDSMDNATWEYRTGALDTAPLSSGTAVWDATVNGNKGAWLGVVGSPDSSSWIGSDFMETSGGMSGQCPFLAWVSNVDSLVEVNIRVSATGTRYNATVFHGNENVDEQGGTEDFLFDQTLAVRSGDRVFLELAPVFPTEKPLVNVSFVVTMVPAPLPLSLLAAGVIGILWRRRS